MENVTLDSVVNRLDRLEKVIEEINGQLAVMRKELSPKSPEKNSISRAEAKTETPECNNDLNIGSKVIEGILEELGYSPDYDPGSVEELHESMKQSGIRAEDNEFSSAIIKEREK